MGPLDRVVRPRATGAIKLPSVGMLGFGVDIGGSGIKGAVVDLEVGQLATERYKILTPQPSLPVAVAGAVAEVVGHFGWQGPLGCTFPAVVQSGVARTAANVDRSWIGTNIETVVGTATGLPVTAVNDADAAGIAETNWGAAKSTKGLVVVVTLGTGIGTALIYNGVLVPNSELSATSSSMAKTTRSWLRLRRANGSPSAGTSGRGAFSVTFQPWKHCCGPTFS